MTFFVGAQRLGLQCFSTRFIYIYSTSWTLLSVLTFSVAFRSTTALPGCPDRSLSTANRTGLTVTWDVKTLQNSNEKMKKMAGNKGHSSCSRLLSGLSLCLQFVATDTVDIVFQQPIFCYLYIPTLRLPRFYEKLAFIFVAHVARLYWLWMEQFSWRWYLCAWRSPYVLYPISKSFPDVAFETEEWNQ